MSKLAIVTGGSSGIGLATLDKFLRNDYQVINLSRKPSRLTDCLNIPVDLSDDDFIEKVSGRLIPLVEAAETIVLVHNAGVHSRDSAVAVDVDSLRQALAVNVIAPALLNKLLLPSMKQGSSVIYIGSTLSEKAVAGCCSYITSKHAVVGLMKSTCQDAAGMGMDRHPIPVPQGVWWWCAWLSIALFTAASAAREISSAFKISSWLKIDNMFGRE